MRSFPNIVLSTYESINLLSGINLELSRLELNETSVLCSVVIGVSREYMNEH